MDYEKLTEKEKAELREKIEAEDKAKKLQQQQDRETYKTLTDKFVTTNIKKLQNLSSQMMLIKQEVFRDADLLIDMKDELFKTKLDRRSNTFTTQDGLMSITLGNRINEGWDDTVNALSLIHI